MQVKRSASLRSGGGLVTPESRVSVVGMNCDISKFVYHYISQKILKHLHKKANFLTKIWTQEFELLSLIKGFFLS